MGHKFAEIAFTKNVRQMQQALGSRSAYAAMDSGADYNDKLGVTETDFISARDSFYMASVSETDWPYIQHRGGDTGFLKVIDEKTLGFADYRGNRQYVSAGNFKTNHKVAIFFMDYAAQRRLKLLGRIRQIDVAEKQLLAKIVDEKSKVRVERGFVIEVVAFDWNCPKFITPRYTQEQVQPILSSVMQENKTLKAKLKNAQQLLKSTT